MALLSSEMEEVMADSSRLNFTISCFSTMASDGRRPFSCGVGDVERATVLRNGARCSREGSGASFPFFRVRTTRRARVGRSAAAPKASP